MSNQISDTPPQVTVLLPVFNAEGFLAEAIQSVLNQTLKDFELVLINDGSTDQSLEIMREYAHQDSRIRLVTRANKGLVATLNEGLDLAQGKYIARLDGDDICLLHRLEKQVAFLSANPSYALCASSAHIIDQYGRKIGRWPDLGHSDTEVKMSMRFSSVFPHSSVCFNADIIRTNHFYYCQEYYPAEDFELFNRIAETHSVHVIEEPLLLWRSHPTSISYQNRTAQLRSTMQVTAKHFANMGHNVSAEWLDDFLSRKSGISDSDCVKLGALLSSVLDNIDNEPLSVRPISRRSFAILVSRLAIEIGCVRGFRVTARVFESSRLKKLFSKRAKLLFFLARALPAGSVSFLDKSVFYIYLKVTRIVSFAYRNFKKPIIRPHTEEK